MKISVITATRNSEATISETLDSLEAQKYKNREYLIVDGNSSDSTIDIISARGRLIEKIVSEGDSGIYDALNKGIRLASGDVVGFLHSDDVFASEDVLEKVANCFYDESIDSVYGDLDYVSRVQPSKIIRHWVSGEFKRDRILSGWMPPHPTFYMRRKHYLEYGNFDLSYRIAADYDSILRYLWVGKINSIYIPEVLIKMRVGGASNRSVSNILQKTKEDMRAMHANNIPVLKAVLWKNLSKIPQFF